MTISSIIVIMTEQDISNNLISEMLDIGINATQNEMLQNILALGTIEAYGIDHYFDSINHPSVKDACKKAMGAHQNYDRFDSDEMQNRMIKSIYFASAANALSIIRRKASEVASNNLRDEFREIWYIGRKVDFHLAAITLPEDERGELISSLYCDNHTYTDSNIFWKIPVNTDQPYTPIDIDEFKDIFNNFMSHADSIIVPFRDKQVTLREYIKKVYSESQGSIQTWIQTRNEVLNTAKSFGHGVLSSTLATKAYTHMQDIVDFDLGNNQ